MDINILSKSVLFSGIEPEQLETLCRDLGCREKHYEKDSRIWLCGEAVSAAALVLSGAVRAEVNDIDGRRRILARHGVGALVGDVLMTESRPSPIDLAAEADGACLLFIPFAALMQNENSPALMQLRLNLVREIAAKYWLLRRRIDCLNAGSLREKILLYLQSYGQPGHTFTLPADRQAMADYIGANRSALCRELSAMKRDRLIDYYGRSFRLLRDKLD